eukprot:Hpha_TRINITY_DN16680_c2_g25::TRINITY_DN16680_c2_g25_i1::g.182491::m.182491
MEMNKDAMALRLAHEAEGMESGGQAMEAMDKWRQAFKLSPALEAHYNDGGGLLEFGIAIGLAQASPTLDLCPVTVEPGRQVDGVESVRWDEKQPRFAVDDPLAWDFLEAEGYVVIKQVADVAAQEQAHSLLWKWIEDVTVGSVDPAGVSTWGLPQLGNMFRDFGIINLYGIGQSRFLWYLRGLPKVKQAFAAAWGEDDLVCSFDGANMFRPWGLHGDWRTQSGWFHVDQSPQVLERCSLQGMVALTDATPSSGGFVCVPRSHRQFPFGHGASSSRSHYLQLDKECVGGLETKPLLVTCKSGDLIMWDSRTVHCNTPAVVQGTELQAEQLLRAVGYVTMCPRRMVSEETLGQRREAVARGETWSHRPDVPQPMSELDAKVAARLRPPGAVSEEERGGHGWSSVVTCLADLTPAQRELVDGCGRA